MGYRNIVVGTDGSATADVAVRVAVRLAKLYGARLAVVCAYAPPRTTRTAAEKVLQRVVAAQRDKVAADPWLHRGDPAEGMLEVAKGHEADLIVVGNKGIGAATRFRLGGVPDELAHFAPCDLLIVATTEAAEGRDRAGSQYERILAGTDGSPTATEAVRRAFDLAAMLGSAVTLLHVGDPIVGSIKLEETASGRPEGVEVRELALEAERICEIAESEDAGLVVVGNKGMSGARRFLGSVPNKVAHYASTDVLIVKTVDRSLADLAEGHGGIVDVDGRKLAVYRDESGRIYSLSFRCTHMGCTVDWNDADKTWDCPCHGSRFRYDGAVIKGPASKPLEPVGGPSRVEEGGAEDVEEGAAGPRPVPRRGQTAGRENERFLIVGASLAGATAAATLREEGFEGRIILVGSEPSFPYERPPLSKSFLRGETPLEEAMVRREAFYTDNEIETRFGSTVTEVDPGTKTVGVAGGDPIPYDRLLITTGVRNHRLQIPGISLEGVYGLRTVADAARIRSEMVGGRTAVLVGMGFIGCEVAASLRLRGLEVVAIDRNPVPLRRVLGETVGRVLEGVHRDHGVTMLFRDEVAAFEGNGSVARVLTRSGRSIECDFVVVGLGVEPVTDLVAGSGVEVDGGILVDEFCRTSVESIYAAGDVANHYHPVFGRRIRVEHWENAMEQGRAAALSMLGRAKPYDLVHWFWSDQYDQNLQYAGYHTERDELIVRGSLEERDFVACYVKDGRVQAVVGLNRGAEVRGAMRLIGSGTRIDPARLRDDSIDLATLA